MQTYMCPSWTLPFVCLFACLSSFLFLADLVAFLLSFFFVYLVTLHVSCHMLCLPCLSCSSALCLFASFSFHCLSVVSCLCLCMYTHGARTHGVRARSPKRKQKGRGCEHVDISQAAMFSRFREPLPFGYVRFQIPFLPPSFLS